MIPLYRVKKILYISVPFHLQKSIVRNLELSPWIFQVIQSINPSKCKVTSYLLLPLYWFLIQINTCFIDTISRKAFANIPWAVAVSTSWFSTSLQTDEPGRVWARQHPNVLRGVGPQRKATKGRSSTFEKSGFGTLHLVLFMVQFRVSFWQFLLLKIAFFMNKTIKLCIWLIKQVLHLENDSFCVAYIYDFA